MQGVIIFIAIVVGMAVATYGTHKHIEKHGGKNLPYIWEMKK